MLDQYENNIRPKYRVDPPPTSLPQEVGGGGLLNHDQAQHDRTAVSMHTYSTDSTHCSGARLMLGQRCRRWSSLKPALEQCVVSVWYANCQQCMIP